MSLTSPHDILSAYSRGEISSSRAIGLLHLDGYRSLLIALADAGHALPRPSQQEVEDQLRAALPLMREALWRADADHA
jgi:hypothetical protein